MEAAAIKRIEELTGGHSIGDEFPIPGIVVAGDSEVVSLEKFQDSPRRMRAKFTTERIADFCRYADTNKTGDEGAVFVKPDGSGAKAVMDWGSPSAPKWGDHRAYLEMKYTPEFAAVAGICDGPALDQRGVIDFLEDWRHILHPIIEGEGENTEVTVARAISAIRRIDINAINNRNHEEGDFKASRTAMESVEAASSDGEIPGLFRAECKVYPETASRAIDLRLSLMTGGDKPRLRFRMVSRDALMQALAEEVEAKLAENLAAHTVYVGTS